MGVNTIGNLVLDELVASPKMPLFTHTITITGTAGAELKRGQLIGKKTDGGVVYGAMATGSTVYGILAEDAKFADGATTAKAIVYVTGHFNANKVIGYEASHYDSMRALGMIVDKAIAY